MNGCSLWNYIYTLLYEPFISARWRNSKSPYICKQTWAEGHFIYLNISRFYGESTFYLNRYVNKKCAQ
jgi:hypothetical protein